MSLHRIPPPIRFMLLHGLVGFGLSAMFVAAVLWADPGGVGQLILKHGGFPVVAMLWFFSGLTFGSVQIGAAVMLQDGQDDAPRGGHRQRLESVSVPVRVRR
ncbi:hypothetical protein [Neoroseomonas lacus]|uniref:Uncharacterized protein n=1 Tax=Neoroseomonas lacus TaxID=287609 RepID=A0A917KF71_9PROT|nr:hypothetical protein [Neoroseomonas lacus]GGJ09591.1 hypothetical protein GCM10011320_15780 [Neoroseomonas lacus]